MDDVAGTNDERRLAAPVPVVVDPARVESVLTAHPGASVSGDAFVVPHGRRYDRHTGAASESLLFHGKETR